MLEQRVQRAERIVLRVAGGLVDFVDRRSPGSRSCRSRAHRTPCPAWRCATATTPPTESSPPSANSSPRSGTRCRAGARTASRNASCRCRGRRAAGSASVRAGPRFRDTARPACGCRRAAPRKLGSVVDQIVDRRHPVRLHAKAQIAGFEHLFVGRAQRVVRAIAADRSARSRPVEIVHPAERRHREFLFDHCCCHRSPRLHVVDGFSVSTTKGRASEQSHACAANSGKKGSDDGNCGPRRKTRVAGVRRRRLWPGVLLAVLLRGAGWAPFQVQCNEAIFACKPAVVPLCC